MECRRRNLLPPVFSAVLVCLMAVAPPPAPSLASAAAGVPKAGVEGAESYLLRSSAEGDEFSILMPSQPTAVVSHLDFSFKVEGQMIDEERVFSSYAEGVVFLVRVLKTSNGRKALDEYLAARGRGGKDTPDGAPGREILLGGFAGRQEEIRGKTRSYRESFYRRIQYFATRRNVYMVSATARDENNPAIAAYFSSLKLGRMIYDAGAADAAMKGTPATAPSAAQGAPEAGQVLKPEEVTRKAVLVWEPDPAVYQEIHDLNGPIFKMKLQMLLSADGRVAEVKILSGLTQKINEKVVTAARYMRFIPAEKDGRPVSQWHTAEYVFRR